jgi:hypothetical protein
MIRHPIVIALLLTCGLPALATEPGGAIPFPPKTITTPAIKMTGQRPPEAPPGEGLSAGFQPKTVTTAPLKMTGQRPEPEPPGEDLSAGFQPRTVTTPAIKMTGKR